MAKKAPPSKTKNAASLSLELRTLDRNQRISKVYEQIQQTAPELEAMLQSTDPSARVQIVRAKGFPITPEVWHFVIRIIHDPAIRSGLESGAAGWLAGQALTWIKSKVTNAAVTPVAVEESSSKAAAPKTATKKPSSRQAKSRRKTRK